MVVDDSRVLGLPMTAAYCRLILRRFGDRPARRAALLAGTGLDPARAGDAGRDDVDAEITVGAQLAQLENLARIAGPGFGLALGAVLEGVAHGPAGAVAVTAPTLGAALDALVRYATVRTPFIDLRSTRDGARLVLHVVETCGLGGVRRAVLEMVLASIQGVAEAALGRRLDGALFTLPAPAPPYAAEVAALLHGEVRHAGRGASVALPVDWLRLACPLADPVAHRAACSRLEALRQRLAGDFVDAMVERALDGSDGGVTLGDVARRLKVSPRTLVRKLGARGTSFRALLDAHRRRRAAELLGQRELSVADIAERLGYDDATNFARACRRWFALSPRAFRARAGAGAPPRPPRPARRPAVA